MINRFGIAYLLTILTTILIACTPQTTETQLPSPDISTPDEHKFQEIDSVSMDKLIGTLENSGMTIEIGGIIEAPYFSTRGIILRADNEEIQVYLYPDSNSRRADSDTIASDGTIKGQVKISWISQPFFWAHEELLVIYLGSDAKIVELISNQLGEPISQPDSTESGHEAAPDFPVAVLAAIQDLSKRLDIAPDQIIVVGYEYKVWPDSCLGVNKTGEMCLQVLTPGYSITLSVRDRRFVYHTDEVGQRLTLVGEMIPEG